MRTRRWSFVPSAAVLAALVAAGASAQQRPTLTEQESRIAALEASHCTAWDQNNFGGPDQWDLRPLFCSASCTCLGSTGSLTSCEEESAGVFVASRTSGACVELTAGSCNAFNFCTAAQSSGSCDFSPGSCPAGDSCVMTAGTCSLSGRACDNRFSPCEPTVEGFCVSGTAICWPTCSTATDCGTGVFQCNTGPNAGNPCQDDAVCQWQEEIVRITGVGAPGSADPVTCDYDSHFNNPFNDYTVNNNDALECIALIEAQIGQPCNPAP